MHIHKYNSIVKNCQVGYKYIMYMDKKELLKKFGLNVKFARMKKGVTQEQFAEQMGVHPTYIGKIETGRINMSLAKILELANALDVNINKLLYIE